MVSEWRRDLMAAMLRVGILSMIVVPATARKYTFAAPASGFAVFCQAVATGRKCGKSIFSFHRVPIRPRLSTHETRALPARINDGGKGVRTALPHESSRPGQAVYRREFLLNRRTLANERVLRSSTPLLSCFIGRCVGELFVPPPLFETDECRFRLMS